MKTENHKALMRPLSHAAKARNAIYGVLQAEPCGVFEITGLAKKLNLDYSVVYSAMKALSRKGLIGIRIITVKKESKDGGFKKISRRGGYYLNPWTTKLKDNW